MKVIVLLSIFIATSAFAGWGRSSSRPSSFRSSPSRSIFKSSPSRNSSFSKPSSPSKSSFSRPSSSSSPSKSSTTHSPSTVKSTPPKNGTYKKVGSQSTTSSSNSVHDSKSYKSPSKTYTNSSPSSSRPSKASFGKTYLWSAATGSATIGYLMGGSITGALLYSSLHSKSNRHTSTSSPTQVQEFKVGDTVTDGKETLTVEKITRGEDIPLAVGTEIKNDKGEKLTINEVDTQNNETTYTLSNGTKVKGTKHDKLVYTFTNGSKAMDMSHFKLVK